MKQMIAYYMKPATAYCILFSIIFITPSFKLLAQDATKFNFKTGITYKVNASEKNKDGNKITMWFSESDYSAMEPAENNAVFIVYDMKSLKMLTVMQAQKMVMSIDIAKFQQQYQQKQTEGEQKDAPKGQITKTGVSEKILGYNCDQYKVTSEKSESLIWVTTELGTGYANFSKSLMLALNNGRGKQGNTSMPDVQGMANGVMLKMVTKDSSGKEVTLEATNVNTTGKEFDITGYQTMKMPGQ